MGFLTIKKYLFHWPLYLLGFLIFIPLAYYYAQITPPTYQVKASLLIKDDKKNQEKQVSALHEIDLINSTKVIENEIEIIKSRKLIEEVIENLKLWVNYQIKDGYKSIDLYENSPVEIRLNQQNKNLDNEKLEVIIIDDKSFDLPINDKFKRHSFNKTYEDNLGTWTLSPTPELKKYIGKTILVSVSSPEIVATRYQKDIDVSLTNKLSSTIVLTLSDQIAKRGKDILNTLLLNYNIGTANDKNKDLKSTIDFLDQKIVKLSEDLGSSEVGIQNFKSSKGLTDISMQAKVSLENLQTNDNKLKEANIQLGIINRIDAYVNSSQNDKKVPSANGIDDIALGNLIEKLSKLQLQYEELTATTPETSPEFEPINRQINTTKAFIKESVKNIQLSLQGKRDKLQSYNSNFETSIRNIPTQEREYINIKREQSSKEGLYTYYLQKREEAAANYAAVVTDDKIIDQAYIGLPKKPDKIAYASAFLLALALPTGMIYGRRLLSNRILTVQDIHDIIDIPIIAELPLEPSKDKIAVNNGLSTPTSERFRALRTMLHYLHQKKEKGRVTLIASSVPNEGKSFISTNLSIAIAFTERKTILLELDMRKPKINNVIGLINDKPGLSDYFMGNATVDEIVQDSTISPNLKFISSGSPTLNPSELLEKKAMANLIAYLRENYNDIIIDSPPAHLTTDALVISPLTDICLYVVRQGFTSKQELIYLKNLVEHNQLTNTNIVFNGLKNQKYGYGYNYNKAYYTQKRNFFQPIFDNFKSRF